MSLATPLDARAQRAHKRRNRLHTWLMVGGSVVLLALCAWVFAGPGGVVWISILGALSLWMSMKVSPQIMLRLYRARPLRRDEFPEVHHVIRLLAQRAGLPTAPQLYYVRSQLMNAFAVGRPDDAVIAVTDAILRGLTLRELAGVLAHELSHIRNEDLKVMALADMVSRMTSVMSTLGLLTLVLHLPALLSDGAQIPWFGIALLMAAPTIGALLQLALSRAREYDADLDAAGITGDPEGLASALVALDAHQARIWERLMLPGARMPQPSVLRSHPKTKDRVDRLMALRPGARPVALLDDEGEGPRQGIVPVIPRPRWRMLGLWY